MPKNMSKKEVGDLFIQFCEEQLGWRFVDVTAKKPKKPVAPQWLLDLRFLSTADGPIWCGALEENAHDVMWLIRKGYAVVKNGQRVGKLPELRDGLVITDLGREVLVERQQELRAAGYE